MTSASDIVTVAALWRGRVHYDAQRDLNKKLEGDLAKVRSALGDIRWKEILET